MKKQLPYKIYHSHIPLDMWAKIVKEFKNNPLLGDRKNSYNRIINKAIKQYFERN